jgi:MSHA biogenesis protein MshO
VRRTHGFTLIELIVTIVLLAILSAVAALFIAGPIQGYFAGSRRADITDAADTATRRVGRDVRLSLPNSVRTTVSGGVAYLELLLTRNGGRYRAELDGGTVSGEDVLGFAVADASFDTLGPLSSLAGQTVSAGDIVVIHNLGISGADAHSGDNTATVDSVAASGAVANESRITFTVPKLFPLESPGRRFQVVSGPVTYECAPNAVLNATGDGVGQLRRVSGYTIASTQPTGAYAGSPVTAVLSSYVTSCSIEYTSLPLQARGLVAIRLGLTRGNETVNLYAETHVSNVP